MSDIGELKERADKLVRQIGLIQTELRTVDIDTKIDDIKDEIEKLRDKNDLLLRENDELKLSLKGLIASVEDSQLSDLPETFRDVRSKMDAVLDSGRVGGAATEATSSARLAVVADVVTASQEVEAGPSAANKPDRWKVPTGAQRNPGSTP